ncbi:MAG: DUF2905 domain-containing protein [Candidatus Sumerlaeia bacterium]|nr:DUF2905 domain-containing protein [Candidatus Sumerlaeia bacterium]
MELNNIFARLLIVVGIFLIILGIALLIAPKIKFLGNLPGDIKIKKDNFTFYFPLATCILLSLLLTIILNLLVRR